MDEPTRNEMQHAPWRFIVVTILLYQVFHVLIKGIVPTDRLPFRYFVLAGTASYAVTAILFFTIRKWPKRSKTWVMWLIGFIWLGVILMYGRG